MQYKFQGAFWGPRLPSLGTVDLHHVPLRCSARLNNLVGVASAVRWQDRRESSVWFKPRRNAFYDRRHPAMIKEFKPQKRAHFAGARQAIDLGQFHEQKRPIEVTDRGFRYIGLPPGFAGGLLSGDGGFLSLNNQSAGMFSGSFSMNKRPRNQNYAHQGKSDGSNGCPEHTFCPKGHPFLGFQIAYFVICGGLALALSFLYYYIADRALDLIESGRKALGGGLFFFNAVAGPASVMGVLWGGFWLTFENGWLLFLG
ncbi:MAG: hypothetical protein O2967_23155 [Proteobacteria bacterium]|nr:hypothetical protein [Pseudomonadota bacterium]